MTHPAFAWKWSKLPLALCLVAALVSAAPSAQVMRLNDPLVPGGAVTNWKVDPDGRRVIYSAAQDTLGTVEIFDVPVDASQSSRTLSAPFLPGRTSTWFELTADGSRIVYIADHDTDEKFELWSAPTDGSRVATKLNGPLIDQGDVVSELLSPDGARVLFRADDLQDGTLRFFSAPTDGSQPAALLVPPSGGYLRRFEITPDSREIVFDVGALHIMPLDGSAGPRLLSGSGPDSIGAWKFTPDEKQVVYYGTYADDPFDSEALYVVPLDGSSAPLELAPPVEIPNVGIQHRFDITPDSQRVICVHDSNDQLYSLRIDALAPVEMLSDTFGESVGAFTIVPQGGSARQVVFSRTNAGVVDLYTTRADGSSSPVLLTAAFSSHVGAFVLATTSRVVFSGPQLGVYELYSVGLDGVDAPVKLSGTMVAGGDIRAHFVSPDGRWAFYQADQDVDEQVELYAAPVDGRLAAVKISGSMIPSGDVSAVTFVPGSHRVVFRANANGPTELFTNTYGTAPMPPSGTDAPGMDGSPAATSMGGP